MYDVWHFSGKNINIFTEKMFFFFFSLFEKENNYFCLLCREAKGACRIEV